MTRSVRQVLAAGAILLGSGSSYAMAQSVPDVPPILDVPAGQVLFATGYAVGTQNYMCLPAPSGGVAWKFFAPQATLYVTAFGLQAQLATHFLSANPEESGLNRPTWQHSIDSGRVWGKVAQISTDPNYVAPGAIPWLLLEVAGREMGPDGGWFLTQAAWIQRINTSGGVAPATGCSEPGNIGALALVPYTTDYLFYKPRRPR